MAMTNRLGWTAEETDGGFDIRNRFGCREYLGGRYTVYATAEAAQAAIDAELAKRDRRNQASRGRHGFMRDLGLSRCRNGSYE
jgi:hypothetical protein